MSETVLYKAERSDGPSIEVRTTSGRVAFVSSMSSDDPLAVVVLPASDACHLAVEILGAHRELALRFAQHFGDQELADLAVEILAIPARRALDRKAGRAEPVV